MKQKLVDNESIRIEYLAQAPQSCCGIHEVIATLPQVPGIVVHNQSQGGREECHCHLVVVVSGQHASQLFCNGSAAVPRDQGDYFGPKIQHECLSEGGSAACKSFLHV